MLTTMLLLFAVPALAFSLAEGVQEADAATTASASGDASPGSEPSGDAKPVAPAPSGDAKPVPPAPELAEIKAKHAKEIGRLAGVIRSLQAKVAQSEAVEPKPAPAAGPATAKPARDTQERFATQAGADEEHPALRGLQRDDDGLVLYHGAYVSPEFVIEQYQTAERIAALEQDRQFRSEADFHSRVADAFDDLLAKAQEYVAEIRGVHFPNLPAPQAKTLDEEILDAAQTAVLRELSQHPEGQRLEHLTDDLVYGAVDGAITRFRTLFGIIGEQQFRDNSEYADKHRVRPDGTPGVTASKPLSQMTRAERRRYAGEAQRAAEALRSQG